MVDIAPWTQKAKYTPLQWGLWEVLLDITNALEFGFNRFAFPGDIIDVEATREDILRAESEWNNEWHRRDYNYDFTGSPKLSKMDINRQLYLESIFLECRKLPNPKKTYPNDFGVNSFSEDLYYGG